MILCSTSPLPQSELSPGCLQYDLASYISHKIGPGLAEAGPERLRIIEAEALRDLIVTAEVTGDDIAISVSPDILDNPECARLIKDHCSPLPCNQQ